MNIRSKLLFLILGVLAASLFVLDLATGAVPIPLQEVWAALTGGTCPPATARIVLDIRLLKAVVALIAGSALSVSGLQMQTLFRNPLAGPYVLGISSGASLGVALFMLGIPLWGSAGNNPLASLGVAGSAWAGAGAVLVVISIVSRRIKDIMIVLILGIMFASGVSAIVQILQYLSNEEALKTFVIWTMGSLGEVTAEELVLLSAATGCGLLLSVPAVKPLNLLQLGEEYAQTMGLSIHRSRRLVFLSTTLLAGTTTAFCGPIGFIGLAVPHVARFLFANADHRILLPGTALLGAAVLLLCDIVSKQLALPVNAITSLLGIPVVVWIVLRHQTVSL